MELLGLELEAWELAWSELGFKALKGWFLKCKASLGATRAQGLKTRHKHIQKNSFEQQKP